MSSLNIILPSKPKIIKEDATSGIYEIDGLYPGYGHTLGNSLRRIILSSLPGATITQVKIEGVNHEFSVLQGVKEDVITILLNIKKIRIKMLESAEAQTISISSKGIGEIRAKDIKVSGQVEILNPEVLIATITDKNTEFNVELKVEAGLGFVSKEVLHKDRVDIGAIALDANFTPIKRANYEVENMRVGDRTDFNRLRIFVETDGTLTAKEALEQSISIMIHQLKAIVGFVDKEEIVPEKKALVKEVGEDKDTEPNNEFLKTRIEDLGFTSRVENALSNANIRTAGGLARKKEEDLQDIDGLGLKGIQEIKKVLGEYGITLK